jgi:hypothetical protein
MLGMLNSSTVMLSMMLCDLLLTQPLTCQVSNGSTWQAEDNNGARMPCC